MLTDGSHAEEQMLMLQKPPLPLGIKLIVAFHLVSLILWFFGQTLAVFDYARVASWGLQDPAELVDPVIVAVNRGIGLADTIVMLPLHLLAAIGLLQRRFFGLVTSWLVLGITLYWPVVYLCSQAFYAAAGVRHQPTPTGNVLILTVILLIAGWATAYLARHRELFLANPR